MNVFNIYISGVYSEMMAKVLMSHLVKLFAWMEVARGSQYKFSDDIDVAFVFSINTELFI